MGRVELNLGAVPGMSSCGQCNLPRLVLPRNVWRCSRSRRGLRTSSLSASSTYSTSRHFGGVSDLQEEILFALGSMFCAAESLLSIPWQLYPHKAQTPQRVKLLTSFLLPCPKEFNTSPLNASLNPAVIWEDSQPSLSQEIKPNLFC